MPKSISRKIEDKLKEVPLKPGVYLMMDVKQKVLYVGKANKLRSRLGSYFRKSANLETRKAAMVKKVRDISWIVTDNELEALALEANLIKQHRPRFNVILRDDKNYPYIKLDTNQPWPRLEVVRRTKNDGALYFGPYTPSGAMWEALAFIERNFHIRPCRYRLNKPMRPCIQHQMGRCPAPCAGLIKRDEYMESVQEVILFLRGSRKALKDDLNQHMRQLSEQMRYEEAAVLRDRIKALDKAWESQKVIDPALKDLDVLGLYVGSGSDVMVQALFVRKGVMVGGREFLIKDMEGLTEAEVMEGFMMMFYHSGTDIPSEVLVSSMPTDADNLQLWMSSKGKAVDIRLPRQGKKLKLVKMAQDNAAQKLQSRGSVQQTLQQLAERLSLRFVPNSIGAFDVSNLAGTNPVGAFVYWQNGQYEKEKYRHMRIKDIEGIDDYAMMCQTVCRTLRDLDAPELVIIDGGRAHLEAAAKAVEADELISRKPYMIGVAKRPDRAFDLYSDEAVALDGTEPYALLLRRIRDEVHRFAISYHKKLRDKKAVQSPLESIPGIGKKRRLALLKRFTDIEQIRQASFEQLTEVLDKRSALAVKEALGQDD